MNSIRKIRTDAGLSQAKFAQMLNVHQTAVSQWEQGRTTPDVEVAKRISELFHVSFDFVLDNPYVEKEKAPADSGGRFREDELIRLDADSMEILRAVRERPDLKIMFSVGKNVTPDDLIKAIKIVEAFKEESEPKEE